MSNSYVTLNTNTITGSVGSGLAFQGTASSSNNSVVNISNPPTGLSSTYTATCGGGASTTIGSPSINGAPGTLNNYTGNYYGGRGGNGSNGCAVGSVIPTGTTISGTTYTLTLGTASLSDATGNQLLFSIALSAGDFITSWSFS